jgi:hypothetical protein
MGTKVVEAEILPDGMKVASRLLSSAIARDAINQASPSERLSYVVQNMNNKIGQ